MSVKYTEVSGLSVAEQSIPGYIEQVPKQFKCICMYSAYAAIRYSRK